MSLQHFSHVPCLGASPLMMAGLLCASLARPLPAALRDAPPRPTRKTSAKEGKTVRQTASGPLERPPTKTP